MGVVYRVRHTALDTILALKVLSPDLVRDKEGVERFFREARLMARLHHPHIVRVRDINRDEELGLYYFVMEYIQGKTLRQCLAEQGPFPLSRVLDIGRQVGSALAYAHRQSPPVIHGNLSPTSVMLEEKTGRVVVLDFGLVWEPGEKAPTEPAGAAGVFPHVPPEALRQGPLDGRVDLYALGMLLYELYAGRSFFAGFKEGEWIRHLLDDARELEPSLDRPAPRAFVALIRKAIATSPEHRYRRAEELLQDIEACRLSGEEEGTLLLPLKPPAEEPNLAGERAEDLGLEPDLKEMPPPQDWVPDEELWTLGEEVSPLPPAPPSGPLRRWGLWLGVGLGVLVLLAFLLWLEHPHPPRLLLRIEPSEREVQVRREETLGTKAPASQPPQLLALVPAGETLTLASGKTQRFRVEASDPEGGPLSFHWTLDGRTAGNRPVWEWKAQGKGVHQVRVEVRNRAGLAAGHRWQVVVPASPPKNHPPRLIRRFPSKPLLTVREGEGLHFSATARDPDHESLTYVWFLDGREVGRGPRFAWTAEGSGSHRLDLEVRDPQGRKIGARWEIRVEALAPRLAW